MNIKGWPEPLVYKNKPSYKIHPEYIKGANAMLDECAKAVEGEVPPWKEPPDYKPMVDRALLMNKITAWYEKKFTNEKRVRIRLSVFDLIADFVMDEIAVEHKAIFDWPAEVEHSSKCLNKNWEPASYGYCDCGVERINAMRNQFMKLIKERGL